MRLRFVHPPRTGGSSIKRGWRLTRHETTGHRLPRMPKPEDEWRYGFTRDPWDRVVSLWCLGHPTDSERARAPFRDWLLGGMWSERQGEKSQHYARPTLDWLGDADFVGRFEARDADLARLAALLGRPVPSLPGHDGAPVPAHIGRSRDRGHYTDYHDDDTIAYVTARYASDIEAFGYEYGGVPCLTT